MERVFNFGKFTPGSKKAIEDAPVQLFNQHLLIKAFLADQFIKDCRQVYAVYYKDKNTLLLAPDTDKDFKQLHKAILLFVKIKNIEGDRSISLQEFFADWPDVPSDDRELTFEFQSAINVLKVNL